MQEAFTIHLNLKYMAPNYEELSLRSYAIIINHRRYH